jgi:thiol-disulfide isomerase/thioredoxin
MICAQLPMRDRHQDRRFAVFASAGAVIVALAAAAVYGMLSFGRNASDPGCALAVDLAKRIAPLARGELAAFAVAEQGLVVPDLAFQDAGGGERHLSEWRGRTILLNLWATWCIPCRKEMPQLNALQEKLGGPSFEVVAVNIDTRDAEKPRAWLTAAGIDKLAYYADTTAKVFQALKTVARASGLPTSLIIDSAGCEVGTIAGPAEWASSEGLALVMAAVDGEGRSRSHAQSRGSEQAAK